MGGRSSSALGLGVVATLGLGAMPAGNGQVLADAGCAEIRDASVEVRELLGPGESYGDLRGRLIQRALRHTIVPETFLAFTPDRRNRNV